MVSKSAAYDESKYPLTMSNYIFPFLTRKRCFDFAQHDEYKPREARLEQTQNVCEKEE